MAVTDFATFDIGHELSTKFDVVHGASLSAVWDSWASYCYLVNPERFARFGKKVWKIENKSIEETALTAIDKTVSYFVSIGMPTCFTELGIGVQNETVLHELADCCVILILIRNIE